MCLLTQTWISADPSELYSHTSWSELYTIYNLPACSVRSADWGHVKKGASRDFGRQPYPDKLKNVILTLITFLICFLKFFWKIRDMNHWIFNYAKLLAQRRKVRIIKFLNKWNYFDRNPWNQWRQFSKRGDWIIKFGGRK